MTDKPDKKAGPRAAIQSLRVAVVVCETDGMWAALLSRELDDGLAIRETRTPRECLDVVKTLEGGVVVCELAENRIDDRLALLLELNLEYPAFRFVAVAARKFARLEPVVRELGAMHMITSPRRLWTLADLIPRHLARLRLPSQTTTQRIWASLPWPSAATKISKH